MKIRPNKPKLIDNHHQSGIPTCSTLSAMPPTKADDKERKRQGRAASPSERGSRSELAPLAKAKNAERMRQDPDAPNEGEIPTTKTAIPPWITEVLKKIYGKFPPPSKKAVE